MRRFRTAGAHASVRAGAVRSAAWSAAALAVILAASGCAPARPALHRVTIQKFLFEPAEVRAAPGDTVEWTNRDIVPHTSTAGGGAWDSPSLAPGGSWRWLVTKSAAGGNSYTCRFHPTMKGRLLVR